MVKIRELSESERVAIKHLRFAGLSYAAIGRQIGCSKSAAFKVFKKFKNTGSVEKKKRCGRPKKFFKRGERAVCRIGRQLRCSTLGEITATVSSCFPRENPSKHLVKRIMRKYGIKSYRKKAKPFVSPKNRLYRQKWAGVLVQWPISHWEDVIFSDECRFTLKSDCRLQRVWRTKTEADQPAFYTPTFSAYLSVMVWGCIGPNGVGRLVVCDRSINSDYYIEILEKNLKLSVEQIYGDQEHPFIFQQDNAPCHASKKTMDYFKQRNVMLLPWPAQSPDINIIENVWHFMKTLLRRDPPRSKDQLIENLFQIWDSIPRDFLRKLYDSLPRRLCAIKSCLGYPTKY